MIVVIEDFIDEQIPKNEVELEANPLLRLVSQMMVLDAITNRYIRGDNINLNVRSHMSPSTIMNVSFLTKALATYGILKMQNPDINYQFFVADTIYGKMPYIQGNNNVYSPDGYEPHYSTRCIDTAEDIIRSDDRFAPYRFSSIPALIDYLSLSQSERELFDNAVVPGSNFIVAIANSNLSQDRKHFMLMAVLTIKIERGINHIFRVYPPLSCNTTVIA